MGCPGVCVWLTGLPSAGKTATAHALAAQLKKQGRRATVLDGDIIRAHLPPGLGFSKADRDANVHHVAYVAGQIVQRGGIVICALVSPYAAARNRARELVGTGRFVEVFVDTPPAVAEARDVKGMYASAGRGEIADFTGVSDPCEFPQNPELTMDTINCTPSENASRVVRYLEEKVWSGDGKLLAQPDSAPTMSASANGNPTVLPPAARLAESGQPDEKRPLRRGSYKYPMDISILLVSFILCFPVWLLIWTLVPLAIRLSDRGPVFYVQERVGKDGVIFRTIKFRTMVVDAERATGPVWANEGDCRVTKVGRILRRTHLDELPQVINIIRGDMSLVGPRPERPELTRQFCDQIPNFRSRLAVRPGIAGLAQARGTYHTSPRNKLRYDTIYMKNICPWLDAKLFAQSLWVSLAPGKGSENRVAGRYGKLPPPPPPPTFA